MADAHRTERVNTIVIGGGQAGLSVGYHLARRGVPFVILDASARIGDSWRARWDSLRLFTPARHAGLDGMPFPAAPSSFPTKDEMAGYLESYAQRFQLPVRMRMRVDRLSRIGDRFVVICGDARFEAENVVVAMAHYQRPRIPSFARELDPAIMQIHAHQYRNQQQLREGEVLVVGVGNSGAEIALESTQEHTTWLAGRPSGQMPFRIDGFAGRVALVRLVLRVLFHRVLSIATPLGRKARPAMLHRAAPLIRVKRRDLAKAGVRSVPRVAGVRDGRPMLEDGRVLDVANVIWCTGFDPGFTWIDLPVFAPDGEPLHEAGIAVDVPGLYFVGLNFLYALSSAMIHGVGRDAARIAEAVVARNAKRGPGLPERDAEADPLSRARERGLAAAG